MMFSVISHWLILIHLTTETCFPWDFRDLSWRSEANLRKAMKNRAKPEKTSWKQQAAGWFFIVSDRFQSLFYSFPYVFVVSKRGNLQSVQSQPLWALWSGGPVNRLMDVSIYGLVPLWIELLSLVFRLIWGSSPRELLAIFTHIYIYCSCIYIYVHHFNYYLLEASRSSFVELASFPFSSPCLMWSWAMASFSWTCRTRPSWRRCSLAASRGWCIVSTQIQRLGGVQSPQQRGLGIPMGGKLRNFWMIFDGNLNHS